MEELESWTLDAERAFAARLADSLQRFGVVPLDAPPLAGQSRTADLRRARRDRLDDAVGILTLTEEDGVLRWRVGSGAMPRRPLGRRVAKRAFGGRARVVEQYKFVDIAPNQIGQKLSELDSLLTGAEGLFAVDAPVLGAVEKGENVVFGAEVRPPAEGRVLLFVHGTFSKCQHLLTELASTSAGLELLQAAVRGNRYTQVLAYNHPTLSLSPILNAVALARRFRDSRTEVDIVCHSRGGLVVRSWLELLDARSGGQKPRARVVFAGSPLAGTSLAAPARLKAALDVLTNLSRALSADGPGAVFALPYGQASMALMSLFGKITLLATRSPLLDAGVSMIPGLSAQSRAGSNADILELRRSFAALAATERSRYAERYFFLKSNFESEAVNWRFCRHFRGTALAERAADVLFESKNDLVVDCASMTDLSDAAFALEAPRVCDLSAKKTVHHCNYFRQPEAVAFIRRAFDV
jgi:hypothetical protein